MKEKIIEKIKRIEEEENITILLAVESGSRAWGFAGKDSDYDVRFIYKRVLKEYLRLEKTRDVFECPIENKLDISGWDISKALKLLHASNPAVFEWLQSPIVYKKTSEITEFEKLAKKYFSKTKILNHYYHIAVSHYNKLIEGRLNINLKKYFYTLRSVAAALYTIEKDDIPPIEFNVLRNAVFPEEINIIIDDLIKIKRENNEAKPVKRIMKIDNFIENKIKEIADVIQQSDAEESGSWRDLNDYFIKVLKP
jgi:predicted nucleotidyltransferase